jgi:hypothetical protein
MRKTAKGTLQQYLKDMDARKLQTLRTIETSGLTYTWLIAQGSSR